MVTVKSSHVEFRFYRPGAQHVNVVGDFTGWREDQVPMHQTTEGYWQADVSLPGGCFRFRYLADGQWYTDYAAFGIEPGPFGPVGIIYVPSGSQTEREETPCLPTKSHKN
jgi:1,4-alpha-glucan branching enzyme